MRIKAPNPAKFMRHYWLRKQPYSRDKTLAAPAKMPILPTVYGVYLGFLLLVMFIWSANHQLNLGYALTFLVATIAMISAGLTVGELAGLRVSARQANAVFAGQEALFPIAIDDPKKRAHGTLILKCDGGDAVDIHNFTAGEGVIAYLSVPTKQRGWLALPPITLKTTHPIGWFVSWQWLNLDARALVYPAARGNLPLPSAIVPTVGEAMCSQQGEEDLDGLIAYRHGDSLSRIAWKRSSGSTLYVKQFSGQGDARVSLDIAALHGDTESRIAQLTQWVIDAEAAMLSYSLRLGETFIVHGRGNEHYHQCLSALLKEIIPMIKWVSAPEYRQQISTKLWVQVCVAFALSMAPLWWFQPTGFSSLLLAAMVCKVVTLWLRTLLLNWLMLLLLLPLGLLIIYSQYASQGLLFSFLMLLALMGSAKLLESRNERDIKILFLLELALMMAFLMYSQSVLIFIYMLVVLANALLVQLRVTQRSNVVMAFGRWRTVWKLLLLALPFAVMMFFFFPRIQPLCGIPRHDDRSVTGLPDEMNMGDIASLVQSNEPAFRVRFSDGALPPPASRYWRGTVLWFFDGENWRQRKDEIGRKPANIQYGTGSEYDYDLMPVKASLKWLPALDIPYQFPKELSIGQAYQLKLPENHQVPARYHIKSAVNYQTLGLLDEATRNASLQLPQNKPMPQTQVLAARLFQQGGQTAAGFAQAFADYIRNEPFYYTLEPPPGMGDVEQFLFAGRMGFCEHYASAMTQAARSVGIPARIVIGYQGGELNPLNGDFLVREESAHAWVELWDEQRGWFRSDPTAAVAPERINQAQLNANSLQSGNDQRALSSRLAETMASVAWLRNAYAASNAFWQDWVIDLNREQQGSLLEKLGLGGMGEQVMFAILLIGCTFTAALLWFFWQKRTNREDDVLAKVTRQLIKRLEKAGYHKKNRESVADFLRRIAQYFPAKQAITLKYISLHYEQVRYYSNENNSQLIDCIRRFRVSNR